MTQALLIRSGLIALSWIPLSSPFLSAATPRLKFESSWIGNSFPGATKWVQQDIRAMVVTEDGTVFANVEWDEAGREVGVYRDRDVVGIARHTHGWGYHGGRAIALNSRYVFIGQNVGNKGGGLKCTNTWPAKGLTWHGISRRVRSDITKGAPFSGGKGDTLKGCYLVASKIPEKTNGGATVLESCTTAGKLRQASETAGLRKSGFQGLDARGNPTSTFTGVAAFPHPAQFKQVKRLRYDLATGSITSSPSPSPR